MSYGYYSSQAESYRRQGMEKDALRNEHYMRTELVKQMGGSISDKKSYESASAKYYEAKASGREADAATYQKHMDLAMANLLRR